MLYLAADHRGYNLKEYLKDYLSKAKITFKDLGNAKFEPEDDYPDFAFKLAQEVAKSPGGNSGVMICGSGLGMVVAANKVKGIRAGMAASSWLAKHGRENDDLNVIALAADITDFRAAEEILKTWLEAKFQPEERYIRRVRKIEQFEKEHLI